MESLIQGRRPASVFRFFEEISTVPRPSFHEEKIADYLVSFAESRGLEFYRDGANNVLIKAPAADGWEGRAPLLFQGHTDMVCEKNGDVQHDFMNDPLILFLDGDELGARGTTLGADNGIAVAMMLAILDGEIKEHPAVECLFTTGEEVGLNGAYAFDYSRIKARRLINLDSGGVGSIIAGCAGGMRSDLVLNCEKEPAAGTFFRVTVKGLAGGHSGEDIDSGRANANKLTGRLLASLRKESGTRVISVAGGSKDNAIPRECVTVLAVTDADDAKKSLSAAAERIKAELSDADRAFAVKVEPCGDAVDGMLSEKDTAAVTAILACAANGVLEMNDRIPGLPEFSRNLGVVKSEDGRIIFTFSSRSGIESRLDASANELDALAAVTGCKTCHYARYPGWKYAEKSVLRDAYVTACQKVLGHRPKVYTIHAGLECGIISSKVPDMDIISVGPDMKNIHSPDERLSLSSVETFWRTLEEVVKLL